GASVWRPDTSQPATWTSGIPGAIGLRASGRSATQSFPGRIEMRMPLHHRRRDRAAVGQAHGDDGPGPCEMRRDEAETDRASQRRRQPARGDAPDDAASILHDLASLRGYQRQIHGLERDQALVVATLGLPGELGFADEVLLVELHQRAQTGPERLG